MNLMQFKLGLSIPKFFQQLGIEALCTANLEIEANLNICRFMWINNLQVELKTDLGLASTLFSEQ
jgi:hypothetical protein